jgi:hypothetical protein
VLIRSANNPGDGGLLAGRHQGRRGGGQHHADAARRRTAKIVDKAEISLRCATPG